MITVLMTPLPGGAHDRPGKRKEETVTEKKPTTAFGRHFKFRQIKEGTS